MRKLIAAIILALAALAAQAGEYGQKSDDQVWATAMVRAYHTDRKAVYNENTLGVGVEYGKAGSDVKLVAGMYTNSYNNVSVYGGATWLPLELGNFKLGGMVGLISGYPRYKNVLGPVAAGVVAYEGEKYGANVLIVPPVPGNRTASEGTWTFGFQVKWKYE